MTDPLSQTARIGELNHQVGQMQGEITALHEETRRLHEQLRRATSLNQAHDQTVRQLQHGFDTQLAAKDQAIERLEASVRVRDKQLGRMRRRLQKLEGHPDEDLPLAEMSNADIVGASRY